jgi:putative peptidoglycan lipid II flippase
LAPEPGSSSTVARSAASAGAATLTSRVLGVVREQVIAAYFGAGAATDAYYVAFRIPQLLRDLFAEGAMSAAFIPTFTRHLTTSGKESAWRLGNHVINALILVTGTLVVLGIVFAEPIILLFADDKFTASPEKLALTVQLTRIMLPTLTLIALAAALMGMLNSLHHYFVPSLSPAMFNVMTILCAITLVPVLPGFGIEPMVAVAIGTLLGGVAQLALQYPTLHREGFRYRVDLDWRDEGLRRMLTLMGPGAVGMAATQVNVFVNTLLATSTVEGAVTWLSYAFRLMYLPIGLFGVSIATATLPQVSRQSTQEDFAAVRETVTSGLSLMLMLNVPATVGLVVLAEPIVQLLLERGRFTSSHTLATAAALQFYAVGLVGYSVVRIASPTFYALGRNRTPVMVSIIAVLVNAALNYALVHTSLGYRGLALGTSIAALFNATALLVILRGHLHGLNEARLFGAIAKIGVAAAAMGIAAAWSYEALSTWLPGSDLLTLSLRLGASIGIAVMVLAAAAWLLRIREFRRATDMITRRLRRSPR